MTKKQKTITKRGLSMKQRETMLRAKKVLDNFYNITKLSDEELSILVSAEIIVRTKWQENL